MFRRLGAIETDLGVRLFERFRDGYSATTAGESVAALAGRFADEFVALEQRLSGQDLRPSGTVRITTTDTICTLLMRHLPRLRAKYPEIRLEITISNAMANLTRREADIAVQAEVPEPAETLVGRRIADIAHAIYGSPDYLSRCSERSEYELIGLDDAMATTVIGRWVRKNVEDARIVLRVDALPALKDAACAGMGMALLPCYVGDPEPRLQRVRSVGVAEARSTLWLLTHNDLKRVARIQAVMGHLASALLSERALMEGGGRTKRRSA